VKRGQGGRFTAAVLLALLLAAACGTGSTPAQYFDPQGDGATGRAGAIVVTDALVVHTGPVEATVVYPPGATAALAATIVNEGDTPDRLVSVGSPVAGGGAVLGDAALPARHALTTGAVPGAAVTLPATSPVGLQLTALRTAVHPGLTYPVDFTFARAGTVRLDLPVADPDVPRAGCPLPPDGTAPQILTAPIGAPAPPTTPAPDCSSLPG
jgi:periplasmic copper chaperone A